MLTADSNDIAALMHDFDMCPVCGGSGWVEWDDDHDAECPVCVKNDAAAQDDFDQATDEAVALHHHNHPTETVAEDHADIPF